MSPSLDNELAEPRQPASIELHSIDYVPGTERHGKVTHLGAIWFVSNINLTAMATGVTALSIGAGLVWTLIATVLGSLFGTFFMAFHSAQEMCIRDRRHTGPRDRNHPRRGPGSRRESRRRSCPW